jgi:hypothetical protein
MSTHEDCANGAQTVIRALGLTGMPSANVVVQKFPMQPEGVEPCIVLSHGQAESYRGGTNLRDEKGYPVMVSIYVGANQSQTINASRTMTWRESIMDTFINQRLSGVTEINTCTIETSPTFDTAWLSSNVDRSSFTLRFWGLHTRG